MLIWALTDASNAADSSRAATALWMFAAVATLLGVFLLVVILLMVARRTRLFDRRKPPRPPHANVWRESARRHDERHASEDDERSAEDDARGPWPDEDHNGEHNGDDDDLPR